MAAQADKFALVGSQVSESTRTLSDSFGGSAPADRGRLLTNRPPWRHAGQVLNVAGSMRRECPVRPDALGGQIG